MKCLYACFKTSDTRCRYAIKYLSENTHYIINAAKWDAFIKVGVAGDGE